jgi:hypothetical protein
MAFAQGSRSGLSLIEEVTYGTTPAGNFIGIPLTSHSLNLTKERVQGQDILADRMPRVDRHGNRQTGGDISVDLRKADLDLLLESALFNDWVETTPASGTFDKLTVGTALKSFTIEDALNDIAQFRLFTGMAVSSMSISIAPNQMVTASFSMLGSNMTLSGTGKTVDDPSANQPFDAYSGDLLIGNVGGATSTGIVTSIDFTIENGLNPTFVVGSSFTPQLEYGRAEVSGTITTYFEDDAIMNRFLNETETEIEVSVDDPTAANPYTFNFPKCKINSANADLSNPQSRMVTSEFVALYDATALSNIVITRTPA